MRYEWPEDETDAIRDALNAAPKGSRASVVLHSTKGGDGIAASFQVRSPAQRAATEDCDEPINSSHVCPGPLCP